MVDFKSLVESFKESKIVVVGDIMLDRYFEGNVTRINPEAPVPIVSLNKEFCELGGAANVAANIKSLGGRVSLFGFIGGDKSSEEINRLLKEKNINAFLDKSSCTTEKTRIIGEKQQLIRFDREDASEKKFSNQIKQKFSEEIKESAMILVSDYAKGVVTPDLMDMAKQSGKRIIVDPKPRNEKLYKNVFLVTPNEKESLEMASCTTAEEAGAILQKKLNTNILITRGERGSSLFADRRVDIPTYAKEIFDVTGAGDAVVSAIALSLAGGATFEEAAIIANHAASIAVSKKGTYAVTKNELIDKIRKGEKKILSIGELDKLIADYKKNGKKIVWTNGCFDILHPGHIHLLKEAKKLGDVLVVGINSDGSTRKLKGVGRPLQNETDRAEILSSLEFVSHLLIFKETSTENYLEILKPEFYVKGGDYTMEELLNSAEGKKVVEYGGEIIRIPKLEGKSTTSIVEKINTNNQEIETNKNIFPQSIK